MYRLYVIIGNDSYVCRCFNEQELIDQMIDITNKYHIYNFDIYEVLDNQSYHYRRIMGIDEFEQMLYEYKTTKDILDMSCLELKDFITKRALRKRK